MTTTFITKYVIPNQNVEFYQGQSDIEIQNVEKLRDTYITTNLATIDVTTSEDMLTKTFTRVFVSQDVYDQFIADPAYLENDNFRNTYNTENNIANTSTVSDN